MTTSTPVKPQEDISPLVFDIIHAAVTLAKSRSIRKVAALRVALLAEYPDNATEIDQALRFWANYEVNNLGDSR